MREIIERFFFLFFISIFVSMPMPTFASTQDDAIKTAREILSSLHKKQFEKVWDTQMSKIYQGTTNKEAFIANLSLARAPFGLPQKVTYIDIQYSKEDPASGYRGDIYAINYLTAYSVGKFYERIVVVKEKDGKFRLAGLFGAPAAR